MIRIKKSHCTSTQQRKSIYSDYINLELSKISYKEESTGRGNREDHAYMNSRTGQRYGCRTYMTSKRQAAMENVNVVTRIDIRPSVSEMKMESKKN